MIGVPAPRRRVDSVHALADHGRAGALETAFTAATDGSVPPLPLDFREDSGSAMFVPAEHARLFQASLVPLTPRRADSSSTPAACSRCASDDPCSAHFYPRHAARAPPRLARQLRPFRPRRLASRASPNTPMPPNPSARPTTPFPISVHSSDRRRRRAGRRRLIRGRRCPSALTVVADVRCRRATDAQAASSDELATPSILPLCSETPGPLSLTLGHRAQSLKADTPSPETLKQRRPPPFPILPQRRFRRR